MIIGFAVILVLYPLKVVADANTSMSAFHFAIRITPINIVGTGKTARNVKTFGLKKSIGNTLKKESTHQNL